MPPAVPVVAAAVGSYAAGAGLATVAFGMLPWSTGALLVNSAIGFVASSAINALGSRAFSGNKAKTPSFTQEAQGRSVVLRSSVDTHKIVYGQARLSGPLAYAVSTNSGFNNFNEAIFGENRFLHLIIPLAGHEVDSIPTIYINDQAVTVDSNGWVLSPPYYNTTTSKSYVRITKNLGAADQIADQIAIRNMSEFQFWTQQHRLRGIAYLYVMLEFNNDVFPTGIPDISAVVNGKKVYDPRSGTTAFSDNAALCIRDYLVSDYGFGCDSSEINDTYFGAAANICHEIVNTTTGTQLRYTCNGVVDTGVAPLENLQSLVGSMAGAVTYVQGQFRCHAGAYDTPVGSLTESDVSGPIRHVIRTPRKELFNTVKGTYVDPNRNWQPTDFPPVGNSTYESQDGGEQITRDIELPFTNDPERAQRIGKLLLEKARQGIKIEVPVNHSALKYSVMDVITVDNEALGWSAKPSRILKWELEPPTTESPGGIFLLLQEESSASYDWSSGEASTYDAAPDTNLPDAFTVKKPGTPEILETLYNTTAGSGVKTKLAVSWVASTDAFLEQYQLEYKLTSASEYIVAARTPNASAELFDFEPGVYHFRVAAINSLGIFSEYSRPVVKEIYGLTAAPANVTGFSMEPLDNRAVFTWDQATDLDVKVGGWVRIRYTPVTSGASWNSAVDVGKALPGIATSAELPLLDGTYLIKFVDSTGNASPSASSASMVATRLLEMNVVETISESPSFSGTKTSTAYDNAIGGLKLSGSTDWDDYPGNMDTWPKIDTLGGITGSGTYDFDGSVDLGAVYKSRLTASIEAYGFNTGDTIDARLDNIDDWTSFDGNGLTDFSDTSYFNDSDGITLTTDKTQAPDATVSADLITEDTSSIHRLLVNDSERTYIADDIWTVELYVKPSGSRNVQLTFGWSAAEAEVEFDLDNGTVNSTSFDAFFNDSDSGIEAASNGFYRVWVTGSTDTDTSFVDTEIRILNAAFSANYTGDGSSGLYLWGYDIYKGTLKPVSAIDDVNAALYIRQTDDDPTGAPTWSDWQRFFVGDYTARAFEFQLRLTSENSTHNIAVTDLSVTVDMPDRLESQRNLTSGAGTYNAAFPSAFKAIPAIAITAKNLASGDYFAISNESTTGFDIVFRNSGGTAVSRNFDYHAKGYGRVIT